MDSKEMEIEIQKIKQRNARVEADKAWETSSARRVILTTGTYITSTALFLLIEAPNPFLAALIPTSAYVLSTLGLPFFKERWLKNRK